MKMASTETDLNQKIIARIKKELEQSRDNLRQIKNVLRIPRLHTKYKELLQDVTSEQQLQTYLASKFL